MQLKEWDLVAGVENPMPIYGKFFRILSGTGNIYVTARYDDGQEVQSRILTGIGVDLTQPSTKDAFVTLSFRSDTSQRIVVLVSNLPTTDNRLVGEISVDGSLNVTNYGGSSRFAVQGSLSAGVAAVLLAENSLRVKAAIRFDVDTYIAHDIATEAGGFLVEAGSVYVDENQSALYAYSAAACNFQIMEDRV